jgi:hypothetical protein
MGSPQDVATCPIGQRAELQVGGRLVVAALSTIYNHLVVS